MAICLLPESVEKVKSIIKSSKNNAEQLSKLKELFGDEMAIKIETLYEKGALLKQREKAFEKFIRNINGVGEDIKKEMINSVKDESIRKKEMIYDSKGNLNPEFEVLMKRTPDDIRRFVSETIDKKYGLSLTKKEEDTLARLHNETLSLGKEALPLDESVTSLAKKRDLINDINSPEYKKANDALNKLDEETTPKRLEYNRKLVEQQEFIKGLVNPEIKNNLKVTDLSSWKKLVKDQKDKLALRFEGKSSIGKVAEAISIPVEALTSGVYKSAQSAFDLSMLFRQGLKELFISPKDWATNVKRTFGYFKDVFDKYKSKTNNLTLREIQDSVYQEFRARQMLNPYYKEAVENKLKIDKVEDFYPVDFFDRLPLGLGSGFKASSHTFSMFSQTARLDFYEKFSRNILKNLGEKSTDKELVSKIGKEVAEISNSYSGAGNIGEFEKINGIVSKLVYSGRYIKSALDVFYLPFKKDLSEEVRKEVFKSSARILGGIGSTMVMLSLAGAEVEFNPLSSKFGKVRLGKSNKWVDVTGGIGSYIVLGSRGIEKKSKSSITGKITKLNTGDYGSKTYWDVLTDFASNKLAPMPSTLMQFAKGKDYNGKKPTVSGSLANLLIPMWVGNTFDALNSGDENKLAAFISVISDGIGANATDYGKFKK